MSTKRVSSVEESSTLVVQLDEETGEYFVELPERILSRLGWKPGDTVEWREEDNGVRWIVTKKGEDNE